MIWWLVFEKSHLILAGNLNSSRSYHIAAVLSKLFQISLVIFFQILWPTQNIWSLYTHLPLDLHIISIFLVSKKIKPDISRSNFGQCCSGHDGSLDCLSQQFFWVGLSGNDIVDKIDCTVVVWGGNRQQMRLSFFLSLPSLLTPAHFQALRNIIITKLISAIHAKYR